VPEAAIDKDGNPQFWEHEIWLAEKAVMPPPAGDVKGAKDANQGKFRGHVPLPADA